MKNVKVTITEVTESCWDWRVDWLYEPYNTPQRSSGTAMSIGAAFEQVIFETKELDRNAQRGGSSDIRPQRSNHSG